MLKLAVTLFLTLLATSASAETYRWVNEDGVVTYSQTPPPDAPAEKIETYDTAPSDGQGSQQKLKDLRQRLADMDEDRALKKAEAKKQAEDKALREKNCQAARHNLEQLTALGHRLYKVGDDYLRLTEEDRQSRMDDARSQIKEFCK
ncbi:MAG: DUF4124 domain-containing protein [Candidatus Thiodiazotropha sp.]